MKPISPIEAIGPAFERTRQVLGQPFQLAFFLKIALVAALTQPSFISALISYPMQAVNYGMMGRTSGHHNFTAQPPLIASLAPFILGMGVLVVVLVAVSLLLWVLFTYLSCRLRFTLFDIVVRRRRRVREAWRPYGRQTWRFFGLYLLIGLAFLLLAAVVVGPSALHLMHVLPQVAQPGGNPFAALGAFLPLFLSLLAIMLLWAIVDAVLQDFLLPPMAVEDAPIEGALGRVRALIAESPGSFLLYLLMRFVIAMGISWILMMIVVIVLVLLGVGGFAIGFLLYRSLWHAGTAAQAVFIAIVAAEALILVAVYLVSIVAVYGTTAVFKQSYAAIYFGARYPALAALLYPPPPPAAPAAALPWSPEPFAETINPVPSAPPATEPPSLW